MEWLKDHLPLSVNLGRLRFALVVWVEVREAWDGRLFTVETLRLVASWF